MSILVITSVDAEARAIAPLDGAKIIVGGIGRTNAAAATTEAIINGKGRYDLVICAGIGGALPGSNLNIGEPLVASRCIYMEEGVITASGFANMSSIGFTLGDFEGNHVPVDEQALEELSNIFCIGPIATVATCSGTNAAAEEVVRRTGALMEAMEGAAVVHAARRLRVPAIEIRTVSNTTGDRVNQQWDITRGLETLGETMRIAVARLRRE